MRAVDLSFSRVSPDWCRIRRLEGFDMFIQCLWLGGHQDNSGIRAVAQANLKDAREAGFITAGYLNTNPWFEAAISLAEAQRNAGAEWDSLAYVFNDVEIDGVTEAQIKAHCEAITAAQKKISIYSAKWFWDKIGNPKWPWLLDYPLWAAQYDGDPKAPIRLFGPWKEVFGKQYQGTTNLDGVSVDLNEFDLTVEENDMPDPIFQDPAGRQAQVGVAGKHEIGNPEHAAALITGGAKVVSVSAALFDEIPGVRDVTGGTVALDQAALDAIAKAVNDELAKRQQT